MTPFLKQIIALAFILPLMAMGNAATSPDIAGAATSLLPPRITPDYTDITIPPNIAPLNFRVNEPGTAYRVKLHASQGKAIEINSHTPTIQFPLEAWRTLVRSNAGRELYCEVSVQTTEKGWSRFATITNHIATEPIDSHLYYRLLKPLYNTYVTLGIYQRDLESFDQTPLLRNEKVNNQCLNCHTFLNHSTTQFALHTRGVKGPQPMLLVQSNEVTRVNKTMGYLSWHPNGKLLAYSANRLALFYHTHGETRDVFDAKSHIEIYRVDSNTFFTPKPLVATNRNDTWPSWSPDGAYLYFSATAPRPIKNFRDVRYDILRVHYDIHSNQWGEPEAIVSSRETNLSATEPRVSPDGKYLLFCLSKYGNFPIYQPSSDLYLMDLKTRECHRLEINSDTVDSWHCWAFNSRWIVFSTKRLDGLLARPFFSYMDLQGHFHKPFVLPQKDPTFYESFARTFNAPELAQGPVTVTEKCLSTASLKPKKQVTPAPEGPISQVQPAETDVPEYRQAQ